MSRAVRVILAEDHTLVRAGIRSLLAELAWVEVVGEAADGRDAVRLVSELAPHVVLMDITMAGLNGLDATEQITRDNSGTRVMISVHACERGIRPTSPAGWCRGVRAEGRGESGAGSRAQDRGPRRTYLSPSVSRPLITEYPDRAGRGSVERLTGRQREILQLRCRRKFHQGDRAEARAFRQDCWNAPGAARWPGSTSMTSPAWCAMQSGPVSLPPDA